MAATPTKPQTLTPNTPFTDYTGRLTRQAFDYLSRLTGPIIRTARKTTGSIAAGGTGLVTLTWNVAFADTNYTLTASVVDPHAAVTALVIVHIESFTKSTVVVRVQNTSAGALTGTVHVIGVHD